MPTRIAINGFGRIGRAVLRAAHEREADTLTSSAVVGHADTIVRSTSEPVGTGTRTANPLRRPGRRCGIAAAGLHA